MNKDYVLWHLERAHEVIGATIADIKSNRPYDYGEYVVDISHVYHHLNTAWNARGATEGAAHECSEEDFLSLATVSTGRRDLSWAVVPQYA